MASSIRRVLALLAVLSFVTSCAAVNAPAVKKQAKAPHVKSTTYVLHVDDGFKPEDRAIIIDAFKEWERVTNGVVRFDVSSEPWNSDTGYVEEPEDGKCTYVAYVYKTTSKGAVVRRIENGEEGVHVLGYTSSSCEGRRVAFVMDRLSGKSKTLRSVAIHEAGHLVGLDHIPVPKESIMFPSMNKAASCITELDAKQFCMIHDCDWRDVKACK